MATERTTAVCFVSESIDKRVPPEVWARIFRYLYPSQLSRLSMTNKTFNQIVSSLSAWSYMFSIAHSSDKKRLRTLRDIPESKSYMLYLCAMSLYICECCLTMAKYTANIHDKPMLNLAPIQTLRTREFSYVGEELDVNWKINMCPNCTIKNRDTYTPCLDEKTRKRLLWYRQQE